MEPQPKPTRKRSYFKQLELISNSTRTVLFEKTNPDAGIQFYLPKGGIQVNNVYLHREYRPVY